MQVIVLDRMVLGQEVYVITLATEKLFGHGQEDDVSVAILQASREKLLDRTTVRLKLLRLLTNPSLWLARLAWSEMHGAPMRRWHLDAAVRQVGGMLITDSRGIFDALTRSESPQLRLRSSRTGEEARGIKEQCAVSNARIHWVNFDDVGRQSDQTWISRSCCDGIVPGQETMEKYC